MAMSTTSIGGDAVSTAPARLLRLPVVLQITGLGRTTIYKLIASEQFPRPVKVTAKAVAWRATDVDLWSATRLPSPFARPPSEQRNTGGRSQAIGAGPLDP